MKKRNSLITLISLFFVIAFIFSFSSCASTNNVVKNENAEEPQYESLITGISEIQKYGNLILYLSSEDMLDYGYEYGDLLSVSVNGNVLLVPYCTNYADVDLGELVLRDADGTLILAINMGDFATTYGIATKVTNEDKSYSWNAIPDGGLESVDVVIDMAEKGGYREEYLIRQLTRTNNREDYSSDEVFANFREIKGGKLGNCALYRSSSPVNNELGRAKYADAFTKENKVNAVINLSDSPENIESYFKNEDFSSLYYKSLYESGKVKALNLGVDFKAPEFKSGLKEGLKFFVENEGPYLVHCTEGKDRAGFVSALLSSLMGLSYDEMVNDYMTSYYNYYGVEKGTEQYDAIVKSNIDSILKNFSSGDDYERGAREYLLSIGLSGDEINTLVKNLSKNY